MPPFLHFLPRPRVHSGSAFEFRPCFASRRTDGAQQIDIVTICCGVVPSMTLYLIYAPERSSAAKMSSLPRGIAAYLLLRLSGLKPPPVQKIQKMILITLFRAPYPSGLIY